jgi:hypothetical protein
MVAAADLPTLSRDKQRAHKPDVNKDSSTDPYFALKAPKGKEANWIQTVAGKGWLIALRSKVRWSPGSDKSVCRRKHASGGIDQVRCCK